MPSNEIRNKARLRNYKKAVVISIIIAIFLIIPLKLVTNENQNTEFVKSGEHVISMNRSNLCKQNACCLVNSSTLETYGFKKCCKIICGNFNTDSYNLSRVVDKIVKNSCQEPLVNLVIENATFVDDQMTPGWIYSNNYTFSSLTITDFPYPLTILPNSFNGRVFEKMTQFNLKNVNLANMKKDFFNGLKHLEYFYFYNSNVVSIDEDVALGFHKTLEVLQIHNSKLELSNLTGKVEFEKLYIADLRFNTFDIIKSNTFQGLKFCQTIHLEFNNISQIQNGAFKNLQALRLISLNNNNFENLSQDIFDENILNLTIALYGNLWYCDCSLKWLQNYVLNKNLTADFIMPRCRWPTNATFDEIDFCPSTGSTKDANHTTDVPLTTISHTSETSPNSTLDVSHNTTTEHSTPSQPNNFTTITPESNITTIPGSGICDTKFPRVYFRKSAKLSVITNKFEFKIIKDKYKLIPNFVKEVNTSQNIAIVWYNTNDLKVHEEYFNNKSTFQFKSLEVLIENDGIYFVCLFYYDKNNKIDELSPFDCNPYGVFPDSFWLYNDRKSLIISLFTVFLLVIILMGGLNIYIVMRFYPTLLKGSKSVEIVKPRNDKNNKKTGAKSFPELKLSSCSRAKNQFALRSLSDSSLSIYMSANYTESKTLSYKRSSNTEKDVPPKVPPRLSGENFITNI